MGSDVELGMDKATLIQRLGDPAYDLTFFESKGEVLGWEKVVIHENVFKQSIFVTIGEEDKVISGDVFNRIFGYKFSVELNNK